MQSSKKNIHIFTFDEEALKIYFFVIFVYGGNSLYCVHFTVEDKHWETDNQRLGKHREVTSKQSGFVTAIVCQDSFK